MSRKKKTDKPDEKKADKLPMRRILQNNIYILKLIQRAAPSYIIVDMILDLLWTVIEFFSGAFLLKVVVDRLKGDEPIETLVAIILGMSLIHMAVYFCQMLFWHIYGSATHLRLRAKITKELIRQMSAVELSRYEDPEYYEKYIKAMSEAQNRSFRVLWSLEWLFDQLFSLVANTILLFTIDPILVLFALVPFAVGFLRRVRNKIAFKENEEVQKIEWRRSYIQRAFYLSDYSKEMRLTSMPEKLLIDHKQTVADFKVIKRKYGLRVAVLDYIARVSHEVVTILGASLYAVYATMVRGTMSAGDCLVVLNSIGSVSGYLQGLVTNIASFHEHGLYIENLRAFLDYEPAIKPNPDGLSATEAPDAILVADHLRYRYAGAERDALTDVSVRIAPGEKIALVGQNGSGKSTFVKLLLHLYEPAEGTVTLGARPMTDYSLDSWRAYFDTVFQDFRTFAIPVSENVLMRPMRTDPAGMAADRARVEWALRESGAWERVAKMPHGMDTMLTREFDDKGEVLSGGEAQKIALARVFAGEAPVVILDEPTSALDPVAEYRVFENMMQACANRAVVFISHRLSSAVLADRVYLFEDGRITESGTHRELMARGGHYADMFRKQAESYRETPVGASTDTREEVEA